MRASYDICISRRQARTAESNNLGRQKSVQPQTEKGFHRVHCQRVLSSRHGSQDFEVQPPDDEDKNPGIVRMDGNAA
jgi:hypothetical protein